MIGWLESTNKRYRGWDISTQFISRKLTVVCSVVITFLMLALVVVSTIFTSFGAHDYHKNVSLVKISKSATWAFEDTLY